MAEYKNLIKEFKLINTSDGSVVYERSTGDRVIPVCPLQEQELDELIDKLTFIDGWIKSTVPDGTERLNGEESYSYDEDFFKAAFSPSAKKEFDSVIKEMMSFLKTKNKDEITMDDFVNIACRSDSKSSSRILNMLGGTSAINKCISSRIFNALKNIAEWENGELHPLIHYRKLIERYTIEGTYNPSALIKYGFIIKDKVTGDTIFENNKKKKLRLRDRLYFGKDWLKSLSSVVPHASEEIDGDKFGYDENVWYYAFNDGAKQTYDKIIQIFKNNDGKKLTYDDVSEEISKMGPYHYEYEEAIIDYLFKIRYSWILKIGIENSLNEDAGTSVRIVGDVVPGTELNIVL